MSGANQWTQTKPTIPGFYWSFAPVNGYLSVVELTPHKTAKYIGEEINEPLNNIPNSRWWYGPFKLPNFTDEMLGHTEEK